MIFLQTIQANARYWTRTKTLGINIGGLAAGVFVLLRTAHELTRTPLMSQKDTNPAETKETN